MGRKKSSLAEYNEQKRIENKAEIRVLEQDFVNSQIDALDELIKIRRNEIEDKISEYISKCKYLEYDKDGIPHTVIRKTPVLLQKYFFQSVNPLVNKEPFYSAEKLGIVWDLYNEMVMEINIKIGNFTPNLSHFCAFAGLRLSTFKNYKNSPDEDLRITVEKIEDGCFDSNVTMAQNGYLKERMTVFRMKSEQEKVEKEAPTIHIHENTVNIAQINNRLKELKGLSEKKSRVEDSSHGNE